MTKKLVQMAIAYDFDETLAPGNMQEHSFIPGLGMKKAEFWKKADANAEDQDMDGILSYMQLMVRLADEKNKRINRNSFEEHGKNLPLFPGVKSWFKRINNFGKSKGVKVFHYIISSGLREMIKGSSIEKEFEYIFASGFMYDQHDVARWPALAVNYTNKTQYLFRINKGIKNSWDNKTINKFIPEEKRPIPFSNMIYLGDGETDVPCMKMLRHQGGRAIAVYNPNKRKTKNKPSSKEVCKKLIEQNRADYALPADYREGKGLDKLVKHIIEKIAVDNSIKRFTK